MLFVGLDVIGGFVTEINVTSPTGARELQQQFGVDAADLLIAGHRPTPRAGAHRQQPREPSRNRSAC